LVVAAPVTAVPDAPVGTGAISISSDITAQLPDTDLPVLNPPWMIRPCFSRALTLKSMPFQCSIWSP
jgi:hypothetical protein